MKGHHCQRKKVKPQFERVSTRFHLALLVLVLSLCSLSAQALYTSFGPWVKFYPVQGDLFASAAKEYFLYDKRKEEQPWNYGIWQLQGLASAAGRAEVNLIFYPISFFKLTVGYDGFYRYYQNPVLNCSKLACLGFAQKLKMSGAALLTFGEDNEYAAIPEYVTEVVSVPGNTRSIGDETENIIAAANGDTLDVGQFTLSRKRGRRTLALSVRHAQYRYSGQSNDCDMLFVNTRWRDSELSIGAGYYSSTVTVSGVTAYAGLTWFWGPTLSQF